MVKPVILWGFDAQENVSTDLHKSLSLVKPMGKTAVVLFCSESNTTIGN